MRRLGPMLVFLCLTIADAGRRGRLKFPGVRHRGWWLLVDGVPILAGSAPERERTRGAASALKGSRRDGRPQRQREVGGGATKRSSGDATGAGRDRGCGRCGVIVIEVVEVVVNGQG